jgi:hypothetical protein
LGNDRGAILVHVALTILALIAFSAFTIDYGVLWASRRQAQNAADAGALAGALGYINDSSKDTTDSGQAKLGAQAMAKANFVWGESADVSLATDVHVLYTCQDDGTLACVRVDAYRTNARGNTLPVFFGQLFNLANHDVRATATAKITTANATNCLRPWALPDLFTDNNGNGEFDYGVDTYDGGSVGPPMDFGTGYSTDPAPTGNYGERIRLKQGPHADRMAPGWFMALDYGSGASTYRDAIGGCVGVTYGVGDVVPVKNGNMQGPTQQGVGDLIDQDPYAYFDADAGAHGAILGSCVEDGESGICPGYSISPRVVPVPVFDPEWFAQTGEVKISKILGFFIECVNEAKADCSPEVDPSLYPPDFDPKWDVLGVLINVPGMYSGSHAAAGPGTFAQTVRLIR